MNDERLLEPISYYKELKELFENRLRENFKEKTAEANIDLNAHAENSKAILKNMKETYDLQPRIGRLNFLKWLFLFGIIFSILFLLYKSHALTFLFEKDAGYFEVLSYILRKYWYVLFSAVFFFGFSFPLRKKLKALKTILDELKKKGNELHNKAQQQLSPLYRLLEPEQLLDFAHEILPSLKIKRRVPQGVINKMKEKAAESSGNSVALDSFNSVSRTALCDFSGTIDGKMFIITKNRYHYMDSKTYTGSLTLPYTEREYNPSTQEYEYVTRYETIYASLTKPYPMYFTDFSSLYYSDAASNLSFTRSPINVSNKSEKQLQKAVKKNEKKLLKLEKRALKEGREFTAMSDTEFETVFNSRDRNDDVEFRMLYTPYAIKNFLLMVKDESGIGDSFNISKKNNFTEVSIANSVANPYFLPSIRSFYSDFIEQVEEKYVNSGNVFFKSLFFILAPSFSVPLYAQSEDVSFEETADFSNEFFSALDAESAADDAAGLLYPPQAATDIISKALLKQKNASGCLYEIRSYAYSCTTRVEYIYTVGFHVSGYVPVYWDEYLPCDSVKYIFLTNIKTGSQGTESDEGMSDIFSNHKVFLNEGRAAMVFDSIDEFKVALKNYR